MLSQQNISHIPAIKAGREMEHTVKQTIIKYTRREMDVLGLKYTVQDYF